ncbi:MAG: hypothetical protein KDC98_05780 [Planctomycetes bacterium]|nr:hypothetical protein [Planctomycetota bacterium]
MAAEENVAIVAVVLGTGGLIAMWSVYLSKRHAISAARLDLMQKALENPTIDERTKGELVRLLAEEQRLARRSVFEQFGGVLNVARFALLAVGWVTFLLCGGLMLMCWLGMWQGMPMEPIVVFGILGFIAMTMPAAMRELMRRERAVQTKQ